MGLAVAAILKQAIILWLSRLGSVSAKHSICAHLSFRIPKRSKCPIPSPSTPRVRARPVVLLPGIFWTRIQRLTLAYMHSYSPRADARNSRSQRLPCALRGKLGPVHQASRGDGDGTGIRVDAPVVLLRVRAQCDDCGCAPYLRIADLGSGYPLKSPQLTREIETGEPRSAGNRAELLHETGVIGTESATCPLTTLTDHFDRAPLRHPRPRRPAAQGHHQEYGRNGSPKNPMAAEAN